MDLVKTTTNTAPLLPYGDDSLNIAATATYCTGKLDISRTEGD